MFAKIALRLCNIRIKSIHVAVYYTFLYAAFVPANPITKMMTLLEDLIISSYKKMQLLSPFTASS